MGGQTPLIFDFEIISRMADAVRIPIQLGGGIRSQYDIARIIAGGISRVILGTASSSAS